jgi:hypothetical protein
MMGQSERRWVWVNEHAVVWLVVTKGETGSGRGAPADRRQPGGRQARGALGANKRGRAGLKSCCRATDPCLTHRSAQGRASSATLRLPPRPGAPPPLPPPRTCRLLSAWSRAPLNLSARRRRDASSCTASRSGPAPYTSTCGVGGWYGGWEGSREGGAGGSRARGRAAHDCPPFGAWRGQRAPLIRVSGLRAPP